MDQCWIPNDHLGLIFIFNYTFYTRYNTDWIANTEIGLDPNNADLMRHFQSVPKAYRLKSENKKSNFEPQLRRFKGV